MANPYTLITGASSGLGALFAKACAKRGDKLALVARRKDRLDALARECGPDTIVLTEDLSDADAADVIVQEIEDAGAHVGTLINNAGFGARGEFHTLPIGDQIDMIQVNSIAVAQLCHRVVPSMLTNGGGAILNVASTASFQAGPGMAVYYASKAFVLSLSEALHEELMPHNIAVTALCPGATNTEFAHRANMTETTLFEKFAGEPERVVEAGLAGLAKNKAIVVPGFLNKAMVQSNRVSPRSVTREIVKLLQQ